MDGLGAPLADLLGHVAAGDRAAFRQLYDAAGGRLYAAALRILRDPALAEDAVQEAFLKIWRNAKAYDPAKGAPLAWMGVITRRAALDRLPSRPEAEPLDGLDLADVEVVPANARLGRCLEKLPELHRKALLLMYVYGLTHPELAEQLGAPLGTVKSWVRRAGIAVKECLEE